MNLVDGILLDPPKLPGKYDIIPVHQSDIGAFKRCRRYWSWTSPSKLSLRRKVQIYGINVPLWFGTGIHYAEEKFYNPVLRRDPVEAWLYWFNLQWEGGIIREDELELTYDLNPIEHIHENEHIHANSPRMFRVKGLRDILPNPIFQEFEEYRQLGVGMMTFYRDYAKKHDNFIVVAAESNYSIPLGFEVVDTREQSPNYGQKLEVHARGKRDGIIYYPEYDRYGIIDHKTAAKIDDNYFTKLENDPQCTQYIWASVEEAKMYDLPWTNLGDVLYQALRKAYPKPPTITTRGVPSISRTEESTTAELFLATVKADPMLIEWYRDNVKAQSYYEWLVAEGDSVFVQRDHARRNAHEIKIAGEEIREIAEEMLTTTKIYKNPTGDWLCTHCMMRAPCLAKDDGSDWIGMLEDGYEVNSDR